MFTTLDGGHSRVRGRECGEGPPRPVRFVLNIHVENVCLHYFHIKSILRKKIR